jgi:predicted NBD/HSP70 family sugar kinase
MRNGASLTGISSYNEKVILHLIRQHSLEGEVVEEGEESSEKGVSQTELSQLSGLAPQTVSVIVKGLINSGQVTAERRQPTGIGRPRVMLRIIPDTRFAIGVHVDPALVSVVLLNMGGQVVAGRTSRNAILDSPRASLTRISRIVTGLVADSGINPDLIIGAGFATPGPLDLEKGAIAGAGPLWLPAWDRFPIRDTLAAKLKLPVTMLKDSVAAITGEIWVRPQGYDTMVAFIYLGAGLGAGVADHGEILTGSSGNAGELGALMLALTDPTQTDEFAGRGLDSDPAILILRAVRAGVLPADTTINLTNQDGVPDGFLALIQAANDGDDRAVQMLHAASTRVATAAAVIAELADTEEVVMGGPAWEYARPYYLPAVQQAIARVDSRATHSVNLSDSARGADVAAVGAAASVLDGAFVPRTTSLAG